MAVDIYNYTSKKTAFYSDGVQRKEIDITTGYISSKHSVYRFENQGDFLTCTFDLGIPKKSLSILIREIHSADLSTFGYTVSVNGKKVYFRSCEQLVAAPYAYFFSVDPAFCYDTGKITLKIESVSSEPFCIEEVTAVTDIEDIAKENGYTDKMDILVFNGKHDKIIEDYGNFDNFKVGVQAQTGFLGHTAETLAGIAKNAIDKSLATDTPLSFMTSRWWGHSPGGPDGEGGYFSDYKYGQVCYNREKKRYQATTPNMWGSTLWTTMNSKLQNKIASQKLSDLASYISDYSALVSLKENKPAPLVRTVMEWGSGYWPDGDFSDEVVQAAKDEGVILNPEDGLSEEEINFLNKNIGTYNHLIAIDYTKGYGNDGIIANNGKVQYPTDCLSENIFTHCLQDSLYPSYDTRHPGWRSGVGPYMYPSSEMYAFTDDRHLAYQLTYGPLSCVNLEMTMLNEASFTDYLFRTYALGMEFLTMFNTIGMEKNAISTVDKRIGDRYLHPVYLPCIYENNYPSYGGLGNQPTTDDTVIAYNNTHLDFSQSECYMVVTDKSRPAEIVVSVTDKKAISQGIVLRLQGLGDLEIYAGDSTDNLTKVCDYPAGNKVTWFNPHSQKDFDLSKFITKEQGIIKLVMHSDASVALIKLLYKWDESLFDIIPYPETLEQKRYQSLIISGYAKAFKMLVKYRLSYGADQYYKTAVEEIKNYNFKQAIATLSKGKSLQYPVKYAVTGKGKFPNMDLFFDTEDYVVVNVIEKTARGIKIRLFSDTDSAVTITSEHKYCLVSLGDNCYILEPDVNGKTVHTLSYIKRKKALPSSITGMIAAVHKDSIVLRSQEVVYTEYGDITIPFSDNCVFEKVDYKGNPISDTAPENGMFAQIEISPLGEAVYCRTTCTAREGILAKFTPPALRGGNLHNGIITLSDGTEYELSTNKTTIKAKGKDPITQNRIDVNEQYEYFVIGAKYKIVTDGKRYKNKATRVYYIEEI